MITINREFLHAELGKILPVYTLGQAKKLLNPKFAYITLVQSETSPSLNNSLGNWLYYEAQIYSPNLSPLDVHVRAVQLKVQEIQAELTFVLSEDYYDPTLKMYMKYVRFRIPRGGI